MAKAKSKKRATIKDVALLSGVAVSSVSKALNTPPDKCPLSKPTYKRILDAANKLGYEPNWKSNIQTKAIGLLQPQDTWMFHGIYEEMLKSVLTELQKNNYMVSLQHVFPNEDEEKLMNYNVPVSGNMIFGWATERLINHFKDQNIPLVLLNNRSFGVPSVISDDYSGAIQATAHLLGLGHKNIAFFHSPGDPAVIDGHEPHFSHVERERGFIDTMRKAGLEHNAQVITGKPFPEMVKYIKESSPKITAVITYSHSEMVRFLKVLNDQQVKIPEELSLVTFNDVFPLDLLSPAITAVKIPSYDMGQAAVRLLLDLISPDSSTVSAPTIQLPETLVVRNSTAKPCC